MPAVIVAFIMLAAFTASADDLEALKAAATRYVASMKAVLAFPESADCFETIAKAGEYAAAKMAYFEAVRQAMPALLQIAKGEKTDSRFGDELTEIFRGFGEDKDEEATEFLSDELNQCPVSEQRDRTRMAIGQARQIADQFVRDFSGLNGV